MTPENFCYWLQGLFEVQNPSFLGISQTEIIKDHLALVFNKVTPQYFSSDNSNKRDQQNAEWDFSSNFIEKTCSDQNAPPIKTNFYFGGEYQSSIDPKGVLASC